MWNESALYKVLTTNKLRFLGSPLQKPINNKFQHKEIKYKNSIIEPKTNCDKTAFNLVSRIHVNINILYSITKVLHIMTIQFLRLIKVLLKKNFY